MILFDWLKFKPHREGMITIPRSSAEDNAAKLETNEIPLFELLLEGYTLKECMKKLSLDNSSTKEQRNNIYNKLGVKSQAELIINYRKIIVGKETNNKL